MAPTPTRHGNHDTPRPARGRVPPRQRHGVAEIPRKPGGAPRPIGQNDHEGATEDQVGDRTGPAAAYDQERQQEKDEGGVS